MFLTIPDLNASLQAEIRELLSRFSEAIVIEHCLTAEAEIESYLGRRYHIRPLLELEGAERNKLLLAIARDIAIYRLYHLHESIPNIRVKRYDDALRLLRDLATGLISLPGAEAAPPPEKPSPEADTIGYGSRQPRPPL